MAVKRLAPLLTATLIAAGAFEARAVGIAGGWDKMSQPHALLAFPNVTVPSFIAEAIMRAAHVSGVDPRIVLALAEKESSFRHDVKARTSSAEGLFQFLEGTWLEVLSAHAAKHGFGAAAEHIRSVDGRFTVQDPDTKRWLLSLRQDPFLSALMACELLKRTREQLRERTGQHVPSAGDLYLAHVLGTKGAARLLRLLATSPKQKASQVFPRAARANRALFSITRKKQKREATIAEVHGRVSTAFDLSVARYAEHPARGHAVTLMVRSATGTSAPGLP